MKPILRDFPDAFESERLLIRSPRPGDGLALNEATLRQQRRDQETGALHDTLLFAHIVPE